MDQLTAHVRNARVIHTTPNDMKDINTLMQKVEAGNKCGKLIVPGWTSYFDKTYHAILAKNDAKLYLFDNDNNSTDNRCKYTIILNQAILRTYQKKGFMINTRRNQKKYFTCENQNERDDWYSKLAEAIQYAQNHLQTQEFEAYRQEDMFINPQEILIIDNNREEGKIDADRHQIECRVDFSSSTSQSQQIFFLIRLSYERTIKCVTEYVLNFLALKYRPILFALISVNKKSFTNKTIFALHGVDNMNAKLTSFDANNIQEKGLYISVSGVYHHTITSSITCEHMLEAAGNNNEQDDGKDDEKKGISDPMSCPIYKKLVEEGVYNDEYLSHIEDEKHFKDEYGEKPLCPNLDTCQAYKETEHGSVRTDYKCHMALYRHPPVATGVASDRESNIKEFIMNSTLEQNKPLYVPTEKEFQALKRRDVRVGFYNELIKEVEKNGFKSELLPHNQRYYITQFVRRKMKCKRHVLMGSPLDMGQMLALILMTGSEKCCVDLGYQHRQGNYSKWKWFDYCLYWGIYALSQKEYGDFKVYCGLNKVRLPQKMVKNGYFVTYVSTTWHEHVATKFMGKKGMIIEIDAKFKNDKHVYCCDVSWLSKYPDECEILFARSIGGWGSNAFSCVILDQKHGRQRVLLKKEVLDDEKKENIKRKQRIKVDVEKPMIEWDTEDCINWVNSINKGNKFPQKLKNKFINAIEKADACDGELLYHCDNVQDLCGLLNMPNGKVVCKRLYKYIEERKQEDNMQFTQKLEFDSFDENTRTIVCMDSNYDDVKLILGNRQQDLFNRIKNAVASGGEISVVVNGLNQVVDIEVTEEDEEQEPEQEVDKVYI